MSLNFDPKIAVSRASTPPASWYCDSDFFDLEREFVFNQVWQPVGHSFQLDRPGEYFSGLFMNRPYVVVKGADGKISAFYNVCRHHASELVQGEGCIKNFSCPYHGWNYSLTGELMAAPRMQGAEDFDREKFSLKPIPVDSVGPLIWLNFGNENSPAPSQTFAGVWDRLKQTGLQDLKFHSRRAYDIACNWKVYVDNYLDGGYHVGVLHGGLSEQLNLSRYTVDVFPWHSVQCCPGSDVTRIGEEALYFWLFPNFMINRYGPVMDTNWVIPLGPDRCRVVFDFYFASSDSRVTDEFILKSLATSEQVQQEDIQISESVQRGLQSGAYSKGRYAPKLEQGMHAFHVLLARFMGKKSGDQTPGC